MAKLGVFTPDYCRRIMRVVRKVETMKGPGIVNNPAGIAFYQPPAPRQVVQQGPRFVTFKISSVVESQVGRYNAKTFSGGIDAAATGNLAEDNLGTLAAEDDAVVWHTPEIANGFILLVGGIYSGKILGQSTDGKKIIECVGGTSSVVVKITSLVTSKVGKYNGKIFIPKTTDIDVTASLLEADFGTLPASDNALIVNQPDLVQSAHTLSLSGFPLVFPGNIVHLNADGKYVVSIHGFQTGCS